MQGFIVSIIFQSYDLFIWISASMEKRTLLFFLKKLYLKWPVLTFDILAIPTAWFLAYWLQYNARLSGHTSATVYSLSALCMITVLQIVCYYHFKVYRGLWRFSSLNDVARIIRAVGSATLLVIHTPIDIATI